MVDWWTVLYTSIPWGALLAILVYILTNPEKAEKWYSILARMVAFFHERGEKAHVASDIQADINLFSKKVNSEVDELILPDGIKIDWVRGETTREAFLRQNEVVVKMNHHRNQARNFVNATISYVTEGLISHARHLIDPIVLKACDFTMVRKILTENKRNSALQIFYNEIYEPEKTQEPLIENYHTTMDSLDEKGLFTRLLVREFSELGLKMYGRASTTEIKEETRRFAEFLDRIATRERGVDVPLDFEGDSIRSSIVLIARPEVYRRRGLTPYINAILGCTETGCETIYVCASGTANVSVAKKVIRTFRESPVLRIVARLEHRLPFYRGRRPVAIVVILKSLS